MLAQKLKEAPHQALFSLIFLAAGMGGLCLLIYSVHLGYQSSAWPTTSSRIIRSEVAWTQSTSSSSKSTPYALIYYSYSVNGRDYNNDRISFDNVSSSREAVEVLVAQYPAGAEATVSYQPETPENSVLQPGIPYRQCAVALVIFVAFGGFGLLALFMKKWELKN